MTLRKKGAYRMEAKEAFRLRRETFGKPCSHSAIEKEYEQDSDTGEWVCSDCGSEFVSQEMWEKLLQNRKQTTLSRSD